MAKKSPTTSAADKPMTKGEVYRTLAETTGFARKDVVTLCDALTDLMTKQLKKQGTFNLLGLAKMALIKKAAVKGGKLVRNPFNGEMVPQKPKPASKAVKIRPMKALKDMVN